jgi:hypothetical protein
MVLRFGHRKASSEVFLWMCVGSGLDTGINESVETLEALRLGNLIGMEIKFRSIRVCVQMCNSSFN